MSRPSAFVTERLPVLYTILPIVRSPGIPTVATVDLAVVTPSGPSYLAPYTVSEDRLDDVVASLQSGDVRVAVSGVEVDASEAPPMAYVSLVCADGRRLALARLRGRPGQTGVEFARSLGDRLAEGRALNELDETDPREDG